MDRAKWIIFSVVVVAIFGSVFWLSKAGQVTFTGDSTKIITAGPIADHVMGPPSGKVLLIEYGDYECPGCGAMYQPVKDFTTLYSDKLTFVFRNFPLTTLHPNALAAATAAEAAGQQNKYWEMHDALYQAQDSWATAPVDQRSAVFRGYATNLHLNLTSYDQALTSKNIADKIARDRSSATTFSVDSTPTFVLNGKKIDTTAATNGGQLKALVEAALKAAYPDFAPR